MAIMKGISVALALVSLLLFLSLAGSLVNAYAEVDSIALISAPATAEVGQVISVNMGIEPEFPKATEQEHNIHNATLVITLPDGTINRYPIVLGNDGQLPFTYKPNHVGNITFQFFFPGERFNNGAVFYKSSSSQIVSLTVSGDPLPPVEADGGLWVEKQSMSQKRGGLGVASVNGKIYAIGGRIENGTYSLNPTSGFVATNEEYDPATDTWTLKASMPTPRANFAIAVCQNKIYCISGAIIGWKLDDVYHLFKVPIWSGINEVYDPATDTWQTRAEMPVAALNAKANVVDDKIFIVDKGVNWIYDPATDAWSKGAPFPVAYSGYPTTYPSAVIGDKIFYFNNYAPVQIYDAITDSWSQGKRSPRLDQDGVTAATSGMYAPARIYFFTVAQYGWVPYGKTDTSGASRRTTFIYNPKTDSWSAGAVMLDFRVDFGVAVVEDKLYAIGGYVFDNLQSNSVVVTEKNEQYVPIGFGSSEFSQDHLTRDNPSNNEKVSIDELAKIIVVVTCLLIFSTLALLVYYRSFKKRRLRAALMVMVLFSILAGAFFVKPTYANPYHRWFEFDEVAPPEGTQAPVITIYSPQNGSFYPKSFNLTFDVEILQTNGEKSLYSISELYYLCSWNRKENVLSERGFVGNASFSIDMSDIPGGNHSLTVYAVGYGSYKVGEEFIGSSTINYFYEEFKLTSSASVHFTKDLVPPRITFLSSPNRTYVTSDIELEFTVTEATSKIQYSLDGAGNQTLLGSLNFTGLSEGGHNVTVYAFDLAGNAAEPKALDFSVDLPEPFPITVVVASASLVIGIVGIGLFVYFRKNGAS